MKKFAALIVLALSATAFAADSYLQTVSLSSASAVASTAISGSIPLAVQCDGEVRYRVCSDSSCTAVSTDAKLSIDAFVTPVDVYNGKGSGNRYVSLIRTGTATVTCYIYGVSK